MSEVHEHAEHAEHIGESNKRIALLIAVIALCLAFSETLGKSSQTEAIAETIRANDLWAFFQAKTIRTTTVRTAAESAQIQLAGITDPTVRANLEKQIDAWLKTAARYDSEPSTNEGRKELAERAQEVEHNRDLMLARYHNYEISSAAFQIAIVLASASVITGMIALAWFSGAVALVGLGFTGLGLFAPLAVHLG